MNNETIELIFKIVLFLCVFATIGGLVKYIKVYNIIQLLVA